MEVGSSFLLGAGSRCCSRILILPFVLLCGPLLCCCLAVGASGFFFDSPRHNIVPLPGIDGIPPVQTMPVIPAIPTKTPSPGSSLRLDPEGIPLFGSATLESGFSPDPYSVDVAAGGSVDTARSSPACGYISYHPAFVLDWDGGNVPESFLRIYFTPNDDTDTTLLVHTPEGEWLCEQGSVSGSGTDPVLDFLSAPSGKYGIWVGTQKEGTQAEGSLFITGSTDVTP